MGTYFGVMVSQTYAFCMCKWGLNGYVFPESWCLKHMHLVCASVVLNGYTFPKVWCLKHMQPTCLYATLACKCVCVHVRLERVNMRRLALCVYASAPLVKT